MRFILLIPSLGRHCRWIEKLLLILPSAASNATAKATTRAFSATANDSAYTDEDREQNEGYNDDHDNNRPSGGVN